MKDPTAVYVDRDGSIWTVESGTRRFSLDERTLAIRIRMDGAEWEMLPSGADDLRLNRGGEERGLSLPDAGAIDFGEWRTGYSGGVQIELSGFPADDAVFDASLILRVSLESETGDLLFEAIPREGADAVVSLDWPKGMARPQDKNDCLTVIPAMQGVLLPEDWPKEVNLYFGSLAETRGLYMPWWGETRRDAGYVAILQTPHDGGLRFSHPAGGPTSAAPYWTSERGRLGYARSIRYSFIRPGSYVALAKRYRKYVQESGRFVSLREKMARNPAVERLLGSPVIHEGIWYHVQPDSSYYKPDDPAANETRPRSFDGLADALRKLHDRGVASAYLHVDGWGRRGYDNLHPDPLPPPESSGGWEGMRRLAETCEEIGVLFALHDQYRDFYLDAPSFTESQAIMRADGSRPTDSAWYGGKQMFLCAPLAKGYVERNYRTLEAHGIKPRGVYLDVFAVADLDECFDPHHPMSRRDCAAYRSECFDYIRSRGMIVSSEEPVDFAVSRLDLVHHGPYATSPNLGGGDATGIPVPLFSLVYRDSIFLPWEMGDDGGWGIPKGDAGWLHAALNAGLPYLSVSPDDASLEKAREICDLSRRVGDLEMTSHEFLDARRRKQRATYADGTQVTVDFDAKTYQVRYPEPK